MKYLFYSSCGFHKLALGSLMDEAESAYRNGSEVYFLTCNGAIDVCSINPCSNKGICHTCRLWASMVSSKLSKGIKRIKLTDFAVKSDAAFDYASSAELRALVYKGVHLGLSTISEYIDRTRNLSPKIDLQSKPYFDHFLSQGVKLVDAFSSVLDTIKPDKVVFFNGRCLENRVAYDLCKLRGISFDAMEVINSDKRDVFYKVRFDNALPHNIAKRQQLVDEAWERSSKTEEEKSLIGRSFYENRRNAKPSGDKIYVANQKKGLLPEDWDASKRNIAIFNSSEDELAAVGGEFDDLKLFPSQLDGIKYLLDITKNNQEIHFYLRVHPNLSKVQYSYHLDLYKLSDLYNNITVIPANATIDSYALMDACEKVVVFNSTMGIESVFWGKPVVQLGVSLAYQYAGITYVPPSTDDIYPLLAGHLEPKWDDFVIRYGYYIMDYMAATSDASHHKYFDFSLYRFKLLGKEVVGANYQTLLGSKRLFMLLMVFVRFFGGQLHKNKYTIPTVEE